MWIITDENQTAQDIASEKANLSRGYTYPNYTVYEIPGVADVTVGDKYDGIKVTINEKLRAEKQLLGVKYALLDVGLKIDKATALGLDWVGIKNELQTEYDVLMAEKAILELAIVG